jgi:hypothetical protein
MIHNYYHESNDGACLLCRLEGRSTCNHYGFETFIIPSTSINQQVIRASCPIDHVIFNKENFPDPYPGESVQYYSNGNNSYKLFLDNDHRAKYGVPNINEF